LFENDDANWPYSTEGGTAFVVNARGKFFGITCKHAFGSFNWRQIIITDKKHGRQIAGLNSIYYPTEPINSSVGSDIMDVVAISFNDDVGAAFFQDSAYIVDPETVGSSSKNDQLFVYGALRDSSTIGNSDIAPNFALLEFADFGPYTPDPVLRTAKAKFENPEFSNLNGISGSPVFNYTSRKLCGMAIRGGMNKNAADLYYVDFSDINELLFAIINGTLRTSYAKTIAQPNLLPK